MHGPTMEWSLSNHGNSNTYISRKKEASSNQNGIGNENTEILGLSLEKDKFDIGRVER